jgi:N-methylhydantoinase B
VVSLDPAPFGTSANYDRVQFPPRGRDGGHDGMAGALRLGSGPQLRAKGNQTVPKGDALVIEMPGGGGLGHPLRRPPKLVLDDLRLGFVSREAAAELYGVIVGYDLAIDWKATEAARQGA